MEPFIALEIEATIANVGAIVTADNILDAAKAYDSYIQENNLNNTINGVLNE